jgi:Domain of unknown function (DUF1992)
MTERKPAGMTFTSWIDKQIQDAAERGAFDNLPGAGKPLPRRHADDPEAWAHEYALREGASSDDLLPAPLRLRKDSAQLAESVASLPSELAVRDTVAELNDRILAWRRLPVGPPIFVPLVDADAMVERWRAGQSDPVRAPGAGRPRAAETRPADLTPQPERRRPERLIAWATARRSLRRNRRATGQA